MYSIVLLVLGNVVDPHTEYVKNAFLNGNFINVSLFVLTPTRNTGRIVNQGITKRIDRFLLDDGLSNYFGKYKSWLVPTGITDHRPIILQLYFEN